MDHFNVPRKVNRHVLKALGALSGGNRDQVVVTSQIIDQVKHQMRNLVPVPNLGRVVEKSLQNLSEIGLIDRHGMYRYALGRCAAVMPGPSPQPNSRTPDRRVFRGNNPRHCSRSKLDPNKKRARGCSDEESISGDEFDRARKRMRTNNKQVRHCGRWAYLPRVRQHSQRSQLNQQALFKFNAPHISQDFYSLDYPLTQLQEFHSSREYRNPLEVVSNDIINNTALDFTLANVTPTPSLEITEINDDIKKIVDVRKIVETPPLQQPNEENKSNAEYVVEEYEEKEEGVQTEHFSSTVIRGYQSELCGDREAAIGNGNATTQIQNVRKNTTNQNQISKSFASRRLLNTSSAYASEHSSKTIMPDYTKSYIK
ncbi:PREDICTED: uncharacterized protein LOC108966920 [Bactrocera latifrons]|uniref:Uncharacterized protein n=2 Tax=Bactrocera latifrons TaxID=174628 RepID=A0A0K8VIX7_BACLA|nr:PREDICTED: uncharacterized protein LOC108966920 [Bactrocera latifrons]